MKETLEWVYQHSGIPAAILEWHEPSQTWLIGFQSYAGATIGFSVEEHDITDRQTLLNDLTTLYANFIHPPKTYRL